MAKHEVKHEEKKAHIKKKKSSHKKEHGRHKSGGFGKTMVKA